MLLKLPNPFSCLRKGIAWFLDLRLLSGAAVLLPSHLARYYEDLCVFLLFCLVPGTTQLCRLSCSFLMASITRSFPHNIIPVLTSSSNAGSCSSTFFRKSFLVW